MVAESAVQVERLHTECIGRVGECAGSRWRGRLHAVRERRQVDRGVVRKERV